MNNQIEVTNLSHSYGEDGLVLQNINLKIKRNTITALIGPSGSGKSTFLKIINKLVTPSEPESKVMVFGEDVTTINGQGLTDIRKNIGIIFQQFNVFDRQKVINNVLLGRLGHVHPLRGFLFLPRLVYSDEDYELAFEALESVDLQKYASKRASKLSGGQKQRVAIARALVQKPEIILADEPVSSLDMYLADDVLNLLTSLVVSRKITLVISLHDVTLAKKYADNIIGLSKGELAYWGESSKVNKKVIEEIYGKNH